MRGSSSRPEADQDMAELLAELWSRHELAIIGQVETLEGAVRELGEDRLAESARHHAEGEAHKLAGSLGSFGLGHGTDLARELELALARPGRPPASEAPHLAERVRELRREVDGRARQVARTGAEEM